MAANDQENTAMRLPDFSTFEPFNALREKMNANETSQLAKMNISHMQGIETQAHKADWFETDAAMPDIKLTPPPQKAKLQPTQKIGPEPVVLPEVEGVVVREMVEEKPVPVVEEIPPAKKSVRKRGQVRRKKPRRIARSAPNFSWRFLPRDSLAFLTVAALSIGLLGVFFHFVAGHQEKKPVPFNAAASAPVERPAPKEPTLIPPAPSQQHTPPKATQSRVKEMQATPQPAKVRVPNNQNAEAALAGYTTGSAARGGRTGGSASSGAASPGRGDGSGASGGSYGGIGAVGGLGKVTGGNGKGKGISKQH